MDFPSISATDYWTTRRKVVFTSSAGFCVTHHCWRLLSSRYRLHDVPHGLRRLLVSPDDAKTTQGISSSWHVHLRRSLWFYHCRSHHHGPESPGMHIGELYGSGTTGWHHLCGHGELDGYLALGSCHFLLHCLLRRTLVLCQTWTSSIRLDLVFVHFPEYRFDCKCILHIFQPSYLSGQKRGTDLFLQSATFAVARALDGCKPIRILGCVFTCLLVAGWFFVFGMMVRAVILKDILWPQKQEDRDEGGWKTEDPDLTLTKSEAGNPYPNGSSRRQAGF